jgi:response regulator RpfG family c-di-GMP phosphodiesterase
VAAGASECAAAAVTKRVGSAGRDDEEGPMTEKRKHAVLLVDDEPDLLFSLNGLLRREFELHTAQSAREALQILAQHPIDVVMTDQRMPEMTGVELLGEVKSRFPDTIRIVFTGYADIKAVVDGINKGELYRYVTKPWDPDDLIALLHCAGARYDELIDRRRLLADLRSHLAETGRLENGRSADVESRERELLARLDELIARERNDRQTP